MTRVQEIIKGARITLQDPDGTRWSDDDLIYYINEGQKDIAKQTELFKSTKVIPLTKGQDKYPLPDNLLKLQRVLYNDYKIEIVSTRYMDDLSRNSSTHNYRRDNQYYCNDFINSNRDSWRKDTTTGDIAYVIFDYDNEKELRTYPRPFSDELTTLFDVDPLFGVTDSFDDSDPTALFGVIGSFSSSDSPDAVVDPVFGVVGTAGNSEALIVRYVIAPEPIETIFDDPRLPEIYDTALKYWTTGQALRNDLNIQNRQYGAEEISLYTRELEAIEDMASGDYVSAPNDQSTYRGMG